jgi:hypothetical protein
MILPKEKAAPTAINPKSMIIFSQPKMGKTTLMAQLDDALIIDLEKGSKFLKALRVEIGSYDQLVELITALRESKKETGKNSYKYGIIDTVTKLEELSLELAAKLYRQTPMGKTWGIDKPTGKPIKGFKADVRLLPNGSGYLYMRNAMNTLSNIFEELFDTVIFVAHLKEKNFNKDGKEITTRDIALTGMMATILPANVDAVGFLYRDRKNNMFLNFKASDELAAGARPDHLRGQDIEIASNDGNDNITYHWDKIFIPEN